MTGPNGLSPGQSTGYNLTLSGGPEGHASYTVKWYLTGSDLTGALPTAANPSTASGNGTSFKLNMTAPTKEQTITLHVQVTAVAGSTFENVTLEKSIVVVTAIVLSATFRNDGTTAAVNVTVRFYIDGSFVGAQKIARIVPGGQATATYNYLPIALAPGTHQVRIEAGLDGNGVIDSARGEVAVSDLFYKGTPGLSTGWNVLIGIAVFLPVLLATVALRRRQRT